MIPPLPASTPLPPEAIRRMAEEVVKQSKFQLDRERGYDLLPLLGRILVALEGALRQVAKMFSGVWAFSPILGWAILVVLFLLLVAIAFHIAYAFSSAIRERKMSGMRRRAEKKEEQLPETWEARARRALQEQDYVLAVRCLFRAGLLRLTRDRKNAPRRGATNRDYLRFFKESDLAASLALFVEAIEKWYAGGSCSREEYDECASAYEKIRRLSVPGESAVDPS